MNPDADAEVYRITLPQNQTIDFRMTRPRTDLIDGGDAWERFGDADRAAPEEWWRIYFGSDRVVDAADDWDQLAAGVKAGAPPPGDAADREIEEWQALVDRIAADRREQRRRRNPGSGHG